MAKVYECVSLLVPFFDAVVARDSDRVNALQEEVAELEREADKLKKELRLRLPKSFFMPMPRGELLDVLRIQDEVANKAKDVAGLIKGRGMELPQVIAADMAAFVHRCVDAAKQAQQTVNELDELVETGFRGKEVALVKRMLKELDVIESDTDRMQVTIRGKLQRIERELNPIDAMFLYQLIEWIGQIGDLSQRVGSRLQLLLAR